MTCHKSLKRASYLARFGYIGSNFHGLQPNKGFATAGGALYDLLLSATGSSPKALQFSARTDAGVHALENYATFWFSRPFDHEKLTEAVENSDKHNLLFVELKAVPFHVHARANARGKHYRYVIEDGAPCPVSDNHFVWRVSPELDLDAMRRAAAFLVGTHEFDAFRHGGCTATSTVKTISHINITSSTLISSGLRQIHIDIEGSAFLRRMVRIIVGTLAEVGAGLRDPDEVKAILASKKRKLAGPSAPACGLTLMNVGFTV